MKFKRKGKVDEKEFFSINGNDYVSFPRHFLHHVSLRSARQGLRSSDGVRRDGGSHCPGGAVPRSEVLPREDRESQGASNEGCRDLLGLPHRRGYGPLSRSPQAGQRGRRMPTAAATTATATTKTCTAATTTAAAATRTT